MSGEEQPKFNFGGAQPAGGPETPFNTPVFSSLGPAAIQSMLQNAGFAGAVDPEETVAAFMKTLAPSVRGRVTVLRAVQEDLSELQNKFEEEVKVLLAKYETLYAPLYDKRGQIVSGELEPSEDEIKEAAEKVKKATETEEKPEEEAKAEETKAEETETEAKDDTKGVPEFWLKAMKNHPVLDPNVHENDEEAIKFLTNIKATTLSGEEEGFKLEFFFAENPFFENSVLEKVYIIREEAGDDVIERTTATKIQWKANKCLTERKVKKKQRHRGGKNTRVVVKTEPCESFFNFFAPPTVDDAEEDEEVAELLEADYEMGQIFKENLIPRAIDYYLGLVDSFPGMDFDGLDDEDFGEDDEDDEEDDDDDAPAPKITKGPAAGKAGQNPECNQQ